MGNSAFNMWMSFVNYLMWAGAAYMAATWLAEALGADTTRTFSISLQKRNKHS